MPAKDSTNAPMVTFEPLTFERELASAAAANNITNDAQWQAMVDPLVDSFVNSTSATVASKSMMRATLKALLHSIRINKFD